MAQSLSLLSLTFSTLSTLSTAKRQAKPQRERRRCKPHDLTTPKYPPLKGGYRGEVGLTTAKVFFFMTKVESRRTNVSCLLSFISCPLSFVASRLSHVFCRKSVVHINSKDNFFCLMSHVFCQKKHPQKSIETVSKITIFLKSLTFVWNFLSSDIPHVSNKCVPMGTQRVFLDFYL